MTIYAFDKGLSMLPACKAVGGNHFTIGDDNDTLNFSPLQFLDTQADQAWAMDWIESILALNDVKVTPGQRNEIAQTIVSMSKMEQAQSLNFVALFRIWPLGKR